MEKMELSEALKANASVPGRTIHKFETISIYVQRRCQRNIL